MLNDELLEDFMRRFYGYGTFHAPIWFVGMEEGGAVECRQNDLALVGRAFQQFSSFGKQAPFGRLVKLTHQRRGSI